MASPSKVGDGQDGFSKQSGSSQTDPKGRDASTPPPPPHTHTHLLIFLYPNSHRP